MRARVRDVMSETVVTVTPDTPLKTAATTMADHRFSGLPVLEEGRLVGIVTESDFVSRLAGSDEGVMSHLFRRRQAERGGSVGDAMTTPVHTIGPDDLVTSAARVMSELSIKRLPVVAKDGSLVGIVSRADLMSVFTRPDEDMAADLVDEGVVGLLGAAPDSVAVTVADGIVTLRGTVSTITEKRLLEELARRTPGVVGVQSELEASFDDTRLPPL